MADKCFNYFTAAEAEQFSFYRMPKALFTEKDFEELSCEAKVLYGMMLDRMGLSIRNQWLDSLGRAYIIFTVEDVMGVMGCGSQKAIRLMKELDTADGIGLIEKKRIGLGRPNRIYVKNFMVRGNSSSDFREDACSRLGKKETDMSYDRDDVQKRENVHADMSEYREHKMRCNGGNVSDSMKTETMKLQTVSFENSFIRRGMENADRYSQTGSAVAENQNSDCFTYFSEEAAVMEKAYEVIDNCFSMKRTAEAPEMAEFRPTGVKAGGDSKNEKVFVDKAVETMVKELLCKDEKTVVCSPEQNLQTVTRQEFSETQEMHFENQDSGMADVKAPEWWNAKRNDTEYSNTKYSETEYSKTDKNNTDVSSVYQSYQSDLADRHNIQDLDEDRNEKADSMEEKMDAYREKIRENISYASFQFPETENVDELVELMADAMMVPDRYTIRIAGTEKPASVVKSRFMKLMYPHIEYALECLSKYTGKIRNIKAYLLTVLYNSSLTISNYYRAEVNHNFYGYGC